MEEASLTIPGFFVLANLCGFIDVNLFIASIGGLLFWNASFSRIVSRCTRGLLGAMQLLVMFVEGSFIELASYLRRVN